mmetsp:Transcript_30305/g.34551  ORF Transcript_30305/g.34551 Transcript_30305/m.34551 type:complete len:337 (-) Transcript_30305:628-1638(-)
MIFSTHRVFLFGSLLLISGTPVYSIDGDEEYHNDGISDEDNSSLAAEANQQEWYIVFAFSLFFGFFISLFGAFIGYFSVLEDALIRKYREEGILIYGNVVSTEYARGGGNAVLSKQKENSEYIVFVEYDFKMRDDYEVRIRKQMKAKASDFRNAVDPGKEGRRLDSLEPSNKSPHKSPISNMDFLKIEYSGPGEFIDEDPWRLFGSCSAQGAVSARRYLELLILPGYERSAYPRNQIDRACSLRYRLSTIGLVLFDLALAAFCTRLAANDVLSLEHEEHRIIGWYAILTFLILLVLELPLIHFCSYQVFVDALKEEYIEHGEYVPLMCNSSSLSSE